MKLNKLRIFIEVAQNLFMKFWTIKFPVTHAELTSRTHEMNWVPDRIPLNTK